FSSDPSIVVGSSSTYARPYSDISLMSITIGWWQSVAWAISRAVSLAER
ncbi:10249_t:CDS:2, partial [Acaulospora morrowiae]